MRLMDVSIVCLLAFFLFIGSKTVNGNTLISTQCRARCMANSIEGAESDGVLPLERCLRNKACASCELPCGYPLTSFAACSSLCQMGGTYDDVQLCQRSCRFLETVHVTKTGVCPDPKDAVGIYGRCVTGCEVDGDCTGHLKCCRNTCGVTCQPPKSDRTSLPPIPGSPVIIEHKKLRSIDLQWTGAENYSEPVLYVVEGRWHTGKSFSDTYATEWTQITLVSQPTANVQELDDSKWYVFRVAAVSVNGSLGFSEPTKPYRIEQEIRPPSAPRNLTQGNNMLYDDRVDVTIQWLEPVKFDLPIGKYRIMWDKRASGTNPSLNYIDQHKKMVPGEVTSYTLKNLDPDSTYYVQVQALCYNGDERLKSDSISTYIVTPALKQQNPSLDTDARSRVVQKPTPGPPRNVTIGQPYYHNGLVKATVYWKPPKGPIDTVDRIALQWSPDACIAEDGTDITHSRSMHGWATATASRFDIYDLLFDCRYKLRLEPVGKQGDKGRPMVVPFETPACSDTTVVGELEPDCPTAAPGVPHKPPHVQETISIQGRNITAYITWKEPYSDSPIYGYRVVWGERVHEPDGFPSYSLRDQQPIDKNTALTKVLPKDRFSLPLANLRQLTSYVVNVQALSHIGPGAVEQTTFKTPKLPPGDATYRHYEHSESVQGNNATVTPSHSPNVILLLYVLIYTVLTYTT